MEHWWADPEILLTSTLEEHALDLLQPDPVTVINCTMWRAGRPPMRRRRRACGATSISATRCTSRSATTRPSSTTSRWSFPRRSSPSTEDDASEQLELTLATLIAQKPGDLFFRMLDDYERRLRAIEGALRQAPEAA